MAIPAAATKANCDSSTDDPKLAILTDLAGVIDKYNLLRVAVQPINTTLTDLSAGTHVELPGTATNDSAAAGQIGEHLETTTIYSSSVTSGAVGVAASLTLSAGDWDVSGVVVFSGSSATVTKSSAAINNSPTVMPSFYTSLQFGGVAYSWAATGPLMLPVGPQRISVAASTAIYLLHHSYFASGTITVTAAKFSARRVR